MKPIHLRIVSSIGDSSPRGGVIESESSEVSRSMLVETLRNFYKSKPALTTSIAAVPLVLAGVLLAYSRMDPPAPPWPLADFVDEETGSLSQQRADQLPPLVGESGRLTVVRAMYLTASTPEQKFIGYYQKLTPETINTLNASRSTKTGLINSDVEVVRAGTLVRRPEAGSPWVLATSPEGARLLRQIYNPNSSGPALLPVDPTVD